jgi:hypothetical protein
MSNWLDYDVEILASSPSQMNEIAERLKQPSTKLADFWANESGRPVKEITEGLRDLLTFKAAENLRYAEAGVHKASRFSLSFKDRNHGLVDGHLLEVSEDFPFAIFLLAYCDMQFSYSGKQVIRGGEVIQQIHDGEQPAQGVDYCLVDIFAPFQAEYYAELECGSLWQEWLEKMAAAIGELKGQRSLHSIPTS